MIEGRSSRTAESIALWRALGDCLPPGLRLAHDPLGWSFAPPALARLRPLVERFPFAAGRVLLASPLRRLVLWIQLRTRAIDDIALEFATEGGEQIVVLGAGFDTRAVRLAAKLPTARFYEIDHPATQARKRAILATERVAARATYLAWNFETDPLERLPAALSALGLDPAKPTLTLWEGVIPYLTEPVVEATLGAVRRLGNERSLVVLHYLERRRIESHTLFHVVAARVGEPLRFGWEPEALPGWLRERRYDLVRDRADDELGRALLAPPWSDAMRGAGGHIALARPL